MTEPAPKAPALAIVALSCAAFGAAASGRVTDPMLPAIAQSYGVGMGSAASVVTLFTLAYGFFQIVLGPFGDRYGKYRVIGWACAASAASSLACALAPTLGALVLSRFIAGATCAAIIPLSMAWIGDALPYERRQPVLARFLVGQMLGFASGSLLGGFGADRMGIHTPFLFLAFWFACISGLVFAMLGRSMRAGTAAAALGSPALAASVAYVWRRPFARVVLVAVFLEGTFMFGAFAFIATHLHRLYGLSLAFAGTLVMLFGAGGIVFAAASQRLVRRLGEAGLALAGGALICATLVLLDATQRWPIAALAVLAMGTGFYMLHNTLQTNATQMAPERRGTAVSQFAFCMFMGQSAGVALAGFVAERVGTQAVLAAGALGVFIVAIAFAQVKRRRRERLT